MSFRQAVACILVLGLCSAPAAAQKRVPPYDLWNDDVLAAIKDRGTLDYSIANPGSFILIKYCEVFLTSNPSASYFDAKDPYAEHTGEKIRIHGYLAYPAFGGPYPGLVIGHGHGGSGDLTLAQTIAAYGYVALSIDGPQAGKSTGGPRDDNQAWISVDKGPEYGYLYHYAYAGMRALTLLQALALEKGNPYNIDAAKLGVFGASMGGIFTSHINGVDERVKAAIAIASAGNWPHSVRYANSWLYHGLYAGTRDQPYNGKDPVNSIENVDTDSTLITFLDYFDPIRYAPRQYAPMLTVIGTHDGYFPLPSANLMQQAITSAGAQPNFEKRLWLLPNAMHGLSTESSSEAASTSDLAAIVDSLRQWLKFCFGAGDNRPLATPQVALSDTANGLRFEITLAETAARLSNVGSVKLSVASRVDSTVTPVKDFRDYTASQQSDRFVVQLSKDEKSPSGALLTADNAIYFATVADKSGLMISSLVYKGSLPIDLSSDFQPKIDQYPGDKIVAPVPPPYFDAASTATSSVSGRADSDYQGMALTNPTSDAMSVRAEAWTAGGRLAAAESLVNPVFMTLPQRSQRIFVAEEWFGPGARKLDGSFRVGWSDPRAAGLAFRGSGAPSQLEAIGPMSLSSAPLFLPLAPEQDPGAVRRLRVFASSGTHPVEVKLTFRDGAGKQIAAQTLSVAASGTADIPLSGTSALSASSWAAVESAVPVAARLEAAGNRDLWSIDARPAPPAGKLVQPHAEWNGTFSTRLLVLNTAASTQAVTLRLLTTTGKSAAPDAVRSIAAGSALSETVESVFGIPASAPRGAGWLEVETSGAGVLVTAVAADPASGAAAASPVAGAAAGSWSMPYFVSGFGYWTGLAMANGSGSKADFQITAYDSAGAVLAQYAGSLEPQQSRTQLVSQWLPGLPADAAGQIIITSTAPLALLAYFGTNDGASLAAIPFTRISP